MRASHVALLSLAVSTVAPVFAAPLSYFNARSKGGGAALSARDSPEGCTEGMSQSYVPAARDNWEDLVKMLNTRESGFKRDMQARGLFSSILSWGMHKLMSLSIRLRDLTPDELAGRDTVDDILDTYMSNHATREPSPQQETQARSIPDGPAETVARDGSATSTFIHALSNSRDSSSLTPDDVLSLASLASRALDELD